MESEPYRIAEPLIVPASLDPDAVKIIRRLQRYGHEAYLVGGCVRDLSLGRLPKDFDIATSARPRQVKRLFRNSRIIGRRFKLVHIQFGRKIIEVSTFRRKPGEEVPEEFTAEAEGPEGPIDDGPIDDGDGNGHDDLLIRRDNVFGTAEEDALRRDFTINALFYDVADNLVLDYVGGTDDLERRMIRTIGDPRIRFQEDPVRILRAMRFAARLDFSIDPATYDAMIEYHADLEKCAAPRLTEELLRLLSCGNSRRAWELLDRTGSLDVVLPEISAFLDDDPELDGWRGHVYDQLVRYFEVVDDIDRGRRTLANAVLLTVLLIGPIRQRLTEQQGSRDPGHGVDAVLRPFCARMSISRRDAFRVKQIIVAQPRFRLQHTSRRRRRIKPSEMVRREYFKDSLDFFRIEAEALGLNREDLARWTNLHYDYLRETDPEEYERAKVEAPFGHAIAEQDERVGRPGRRPAGAGQAAGGSRGRARRGARTPERPPARQQDEDEHAGGRRAARTAPAREIGPADDGSALAGVEDDGMAEPGADADAAAARRPRRGKGGAKRARRSAAADATTRTRESRAPAPASDTSGARLEFDELRSGPLTPHEGEPPVAPLEESEAEPRVEVHWDDPLPTVGDPGPISVIQTGIDQTEKTGRRRARKKRDAASRELSKEVQDQPALQAFKMIAGDPRGHEPARPRKRPRAEAPPEAREKEKPFDPLADFESIESLFNW